MSDFYLDSYDYELPEELIAQYPIATHNDVEKRSQSRLLVYHASTGQIEHRRFYELPEILKDQFTIVFNESKVFPCRLNGHKATGGKVEVFVLSLTPNHDGLIHVLLKSSGKKNKGDKIFFGDDFCEIKKLYDDATFAVEFTLKGTLESFLKEKGAIPLPPYIRDGVAKEEDKKTYQTTYAKTEGSVAAPTAGLHFHRELLDELEVKGHKLAKVLLHVGLGTFLPVKTNDIREHKMHTERYKVEKDQWHNIQSSKKVLAVGTTSLRVLESAYRLENFVPDTFFETNIFLHPGSDVKSIDALITNFHLPKSTLLMLVASLVGREKTLEIYNLAVKQGYRFFSYGDAMLILR